MEVKFIDLFAGIGGFRSGLEKAGHKCVGYVEWDKFARQSYQAMYDTRGEFTDYDIQQVKGNAVTVPVVRAIGEKIAQNEAENNVFPNRL